MSAGGNMNGGMNRQNPAPVNAQQGNGNVNGNGVNNANAYGSVLSINASQQMDVNYVYEKLKELGDVLQNNQVKAQGIIKGAEQLAAKAAANGTDPSLDEANEAIQGSQIADLALALRTEQQKTAVLLREQQANTALLAQYEETLGAITAMVRNSSHNAARARTEQARHANRLLQAEKDAHLATRHERDEYLARFMDVVAKLREAARLSGDEGDDALRVVAGLQAEVRSYRFALGMEREPFEREGGYAVLRHVANGAGESVGRSAAAQE